MRYRVALMAAGAALLVMPAGAAATDSVVMVSEPGEFVGGGKDYLFEGRKRVAAGVARIGSDISYVTVYVRDKQHSFQLVFAARRYRGLRRGVYDGAQRAPFREQDGTRPGIEASGDHRGCNTVSGRFEVKDLAVKRGRVTRLWVVFEHHCEEAIPALFGEVRIGQPDTGDRSYRSSHAIVRWPTAGIGGRKKDVPVTLRSTGRVTLGGVSVSGSHRGDFPIRSDTCSGRTLAAGRACRVVVGFAPQASGTRTATLRLPQTSLRHRDVRLQGFTYGGTTRLVVDTDADRSGTPARTWSYSPPNETFRVDVAGPGGASFDVFDDTFDVLWSGVIGAPADQRLARGTYTGASDSSGPGPQLRISGPPGSCYGHGSGEFTVRELAYDRYGELRLLAVDFAQRCDGSTPGSRGTFEWRVGDDVGLAPWMLH